MSTSGDSTESREGGSGERALRAEPRRHRHPWVLALVLVSVLAVGSTGSIALVTRNRLKEVEANLARVERNLDLTNKLLPLIVTGPGKVQEWIDSGQVRIPERAVGDVVRPALCAPGSPAVWGLYGLSC